MFPYWKQSKGCKERRKDSVLIFQLHDTDAEDSSWRRINHLSNCYLAKGPNDIFQTNTMVFRFFHN